VGDKVEWQTIPLSEIKVSGYNPREISEEALRGLRSSLDAFGFVQNLVINRRTGNLISGHQRLKALQDEEGAGDKEVMAAYVDVDETHEKAMNVALNNPLSQIKARGAGMYKGKPKRPPDRGTPEPTGERRCESDPAAPNIPTSVA